MRIPSCKIWFPGARGAPHPSIGAPRARLTGAVSVPIPQDHPFWKLPDAPQQVLAAVKPIEDLLHMSEARAARSPGDPERPGPARPSPRAAAASAHVFMLPPQRPQEKYATSQNALIQANAAKTAAERRVAELTVERDKAPRPSFAPRSILS